MSDSLPIQTLHNMDDWDKFLKSLNDTYIIPTDLRTRDTRELLLCDANDQIISVINDCAGFIDSYENDNNLRDLHLDHDDVNVGAGAGAAFAESGSGRGAGAGPGGLWEGEEEDLDDLIEMMPQIPHKDWLAAFAPILEDREIMEGIDMMRIPPVDTSSDGSVSPMVLDRNDNDNHGKEQESKVDKVNENAIDKNETELENYALRRSPGYAQFPEFKFIIAEPSPSPSRPEFVIAEPSPDFIIAEPSPSPSPTLLRFYPHDLKQGLCLDAAAAAFTIGSESDSHMSDSGSSRLSLFSDISTLKYHQACESPSSSPYCFASGDDDDDLVVVASCPGAPSESC